MSGYRDIYSGVLHKCGGRIKTWTKRWMVLRSDYCLYYYKDAAKNSLGVISLRDTQFKIRVGQKSDVSWPKNLALENTFALVTTPRVYFMYAETKAEAEEWRKVLEDAHHDLLEVTRTKSFSGFRTASVGVERDAAFTSQSLKEEGPLNDGLGRPKAHTSVTDSLSSSASAFGQQLTLSSSSETGSPLAPLAEIESMYNVLQHPLAQEEQKAGQTEEGEEEEGEERIFLNDALYSQLPPSQVAGRQRALSEPETDYDYVTPPDANTPQNFSITVANDDQQRWAEPQRKGAELLSKGSGNSGSGASSQTSLEAFYDFAREVGNSDKNKQQRQGGEEEELALYDVVGPDVTSMTPPTQTKTSGASHKPTKSAVAQPLPAIPGPSYSQDPGMIYEDVPDIAKTKREIVPHSLRVYDVVENTRDILKTKREAESMVAVYDVLEEPRDTQMAKKQEESNIVAVYDVLQESAVYEPVESIPVTEKEEEEEEEKGEERGEGMYSEVGFEERTPPLVKSSVGRYVNVPPTGNGGSREEVATEAEGETTGRDYENVSHSGNTPPIPARHATPTVQPNTTPTSPPNATPTAIPSTTPTATPRVYNEDSCPVITRPQPKPRTNSRPRNPDQSPSNPDQLPSNNNTPVDQSPSNRDIPLLSSPPLPNHASSEQVSEEFQKIEMLKLICYFQIPIPRFLFQAMSGQSP